MKSAQIQTQSQPCLNSSQPQPSQRNACRRSVEAQWQQTESKQNDAEEIMKSSARKSKTSLNCVQSTWWSTFITKWLILTIHCILRSKSRRTFNTQCPHCTMQRILSQSTHSTQTIHQCHHTSTYLDNLHCSSKIIWTTRWKLQLITISQVTSRM